MKKNKLPGTAAEGTLFRKKPWTERRTAGVCCAMALFTVIMILAATALRLRYLEIFPAKSYDMAIPIVTLVLGVVLAVSCVFGLRKQGKVTEETVFFLIFAGFLLRAFYAVMTDGTLYQNDIGAFEAGNTGHLGYIYYIYQNGSLPDMNPVGNYQLYQPPLHYVIAALLLKIGDLSGMDVLAQADEIIQVLPVLYSTITLFYLNGIGKKLQVSVTGRAIAMSFAAFLPYSVMMGAAINNDCLMCMFMMMSVYYTLCWQEQKDMKNILLMAVCIGCAMMSKLSGALIAPAMAVLMLGTAWCDRVQWKKYLKQFICFGLVSFPLGLWYSVWRYAEFGMPFGYVPAIDRQSAQYIGMYAMKDRLLDFSYAFDTLYLQWDNSAEFIDYNIVASLLKFSVFGEIMNFVYSDTAHFLAYVMLVLTALLFVVMAVCCAKWFFGAKLPWIQKIFVALGVFVMLLSYVQFCRKYPHVCTMHVRYILPGLYLCMLPMGAVLSEKITDLRQKNKRAGKVAAGLAGGLLGAYVIGSVLFLFNVDILLP